MNFLIGYHTDEGIRKKVNQDSLLIRTAKSPYGRIGLFLVCDGMGGLSLGELASTTVIRNMSEWFDEKLPSIDFGKASDDEIYGLLNEQMQGLNRKILDFGEESGKQLGTTCTLFLIVDTRYYIFQIGDSRVYKMHDVLEQLTKDQTFVQREVDRGNIAKEDAEKHPQRNILLQCIGAKAIVEPVMETGTIEKDDIYMICSDGMFKKFDKHEFEDALKIEGLDSSESLTEKAKELIDIAKERREQDNITTIIVKIIE